MPIPALLRELQVSEADLESLVRGAEQYLAQHAPSPARGGIHLPPVDQLIAQAGIVTGPAPMPRRKLRFRRRSKTATVSTHLAAVADVLERYGWTQGAVCDSRGRRCIRGAQLVLVQLGHTSESTASAAQQYLDRATPGGLRYWQWQDRKQRSKSDVLGVVRAAADEARKAGI